MGNLFYEQLQKQSEPNTAEWIEHNSNGMTYIECSNCSSYFLREYLTRNSYCPNCGKKMKKCKKRMNKEEVDKITCWIKDHIMRNSDIMHNYDVRNITFESDKELLDIDLIDIIASLHNMLYKEVTGEYYDYMFHWANKVGSWVYEDMFKPEEERDNNDNNT